ncbi:MAG: ATP-binding cassette domain-containing protein [Thiovulaceae bacterium]|nr:ATP-binding cassette domain-containing protein [Sulfurimonadaceae bacterium]
MKIFFLLTLSLFSLLNAIGVLDNIDAKSKTEIRLNEIGFLFQAYNLIPALNVRENIAFIMKMQDIDDKIIDSRVNELANILQIEDKLDYLPSRLSGGQQQRIAVARAVASKPKIILADEPTANLDSKNSKALMDMMRELNQKEKITIVFATHDEMVVNAVDKVIKLDNGKILEL